MIGEKCIKHSDHVYTATCSLHNCENTLVCPECQNEHIFYHKSIEQKNLESFIEELTLLSKKYEDIRKELKKQNDECLRLQTPRNLSDTFIQNLTEEYDIPDILNQINLWVEERKSVIAHMDVYCLSNKSLFYHPKFDLRDLEKAIRYANSLLSPCYQSVLIDLFKNNLQNALVKLCSSNKFVILSLIRQKASVIIDIPHSSLSPINYPPSVEECEGYGLNIEIFTIS